MNGDSVLTDGVARPNVNVRLYQDVNNNGVIDAGDTFLSDAITDAAGAYSFTISTDLSGFNYLVAVDSKSVTPTAGLRAGFTQGDVWAEQTYGDDSTTVALDLGSRFGGRSGAISDNFNTADTLPANNTYQHVARVVISSSDIAGVNFAFSFNAVTSIRAGDGADDDATANRTVQGSLRQFLQNANAITGANAMRFTPAVAANAGTWWRIGVTVALPAINDASTTIDGQAYSATNGTTVVDSNAGTVGAGGTVGVGAVPLATVNKPELEIQNLRSTAVVNDRPRRPGRQRRHSPARDLRLWQRDRQRRLRQHPPRRERERRVDRATTSSAPPPALSPIPGAATRSAADNVRIVGASSATVQNNAIGFSAGNGVALSGSATGAQILGNEIRGNGLTNALLSGVKAAPGAAPPCRPTSSPPTTAPGWKAPAATPFSTTRVSGNGVGSGGVTAGMRLLGSSTTVDRNIITANAGSGILVPASAAQNTLTKNSIFLNGGIGIDLLSAADNQNTGTAPFVTVNDSGDRRCGRQRFAQFPCHRPAPSFPAAISS